jgi:LacI family transcriptional regulator
MNKEITIYDIAKELNLSPATISRGLKDNHNVNKATKKRIRDKAEELGYRHNSFASNLRKQKTHTIGVMVHELNSNFVTSVLTGIEKVLTIAGYDIIIAHAGESSVKENANALNLFHKRVDGLIASLSFDTTDLNHFNPYIEKGIPVIFFDRVEDLKHTTKVFIDNYRAGYKATKHLIDQGCKKIAMITANLKRNVYADRNKGYHDALFDNNIQFESDWLIINNLSEQAAIDSAHRIMKMKPMPDGVFCTGDFSASVCIRTLKEYGIRIPDDIAFVGFNNDVIGKIVEPNLTTINYPGIEMGEMAARNLIHKLTGVTDRLGTDSIVISSELIIRQSSLKKK